MSTISTSCPTERSPLRRASMRRRRVGSARTWNTSGIPTYYCSDICRVNDMSGADWFELAHVGQGLGDLLGLRHRLVAADVHDLFGDAELEQSAREVDQLVAVLAVPIELQRAPDLGLVTADRAARLLELRDQ